MAANEKASQLAWSGNPAEALRLLESSEHSPPVCASLAELFAFQCEWERVATNAASFLKAPWTVYAGNVFDDMLRLLIHAGRSGANWTEILKSLNLIESSMAAHECPDWVRDRWLGWIQAAKKATDNGGNLENPFGPSYVTRARGVSVPTPSFRSDRPEPKLVCNHIIILCSQQLDDEALDVYRKFKPPLIYFDLAIYLADLFLRVGERDEALDVILKSVPLWQPVDYCQIGPIGTVYHPQVGKLIDKEVGLKILNTPRGPAHTR